MGLRCYQRPQIACTPISDSTFRPRIRSTVARPFHTNHYPTLQAHLSAPPSQLDQASPLANQKAASKQRFTKKYGEAHEQGPVHGRDPWLAGWHACCCNGKKRVVTL